MHPLNFETVTPADIRKGGALMALIKFGGGITAMSGSIAGNTFARNRYGNYIRARTKPTNPNSTFQIYARTIIAFLTEYWRDTVTSNQRAAWNLYASNVAMKNKLGETIYLTGFNHFIRSNSVRKWYTIPLVADGPTDFSLPEKDPTVAIDVDDTPQNIAVTFDNTMDWASETWASMIMRQGIPQNGTRNFFMGPWKPCLNINGSPSPHASPLSVIPYIPVAEGQHQWCAFRITRADGRLSEIFYANAIVHSQAPGEVPNLVGVTQAVAEAALANAQLILGTVTTEHSDTYAVDLITSSDPVAHARLSVGDAVNIVVSLGPAT